MPDGPIPLGNVKTKGADGRAHEFAVRLTVDRHGPSETWTYDARHPEEEDYFHAIFLIVNDRLMQQIMMNANLVKRYLKVGLPEAMIEFAASHSRRVIESSTNMGMKRQEEERREKEATQAWQRLVDVGRATFDPLTDRFALHPK